MKLFSKRLVTTSIRSFSTLNLNYSIIEGNDSSKVPKTLCILHGLFGNQNNWRSISYADAIRDRRQSLLVDMRNHGDSPHHDSMTYPEMAEDVVRLLDRLKLEKVTLLGHSMGAKVAMNVSVKIPNRIDGLIIVDAAPKDNKDIPSISSSTIEIVDKVSKYNLDGKTRKEVVNDFKSMFNNPAANLLNTNLSYIDSDSDKVKWRCNITAIKNHIDRIIGFESDPGSIYTGPILTLIGEKSHHFPLSVYKTLFPNIKDEDIVLINGAGHWVHVDKPHDVILNIAKYLDRIDKQVI